MYSSDWSGIQLDDIKSLVLAQRAQEVLDFISRRGIPTPIGNRLQRSIELTQRVNEELSAGRPLTDYSTQDLCRMAEAWRTMWDAFVVGHAVSQHRPSAQAITNELLASFMEGSDLPTDDANPKPRSIQFEASTAAFLVQSGLSVRRAEPDFRMAFFAEDAGVAVKRLTSIASAKVYDRMREGANQLRDNNCRGFVALSLDNWVTDLGTSREPSDVGLLFDEQVSKAHARLDCISGRSAVLGVFLTVSWVRWTSRDGKPYLQWAVLQQVICFTDPDFSEEQFSRFFDPARARWEASLTELARLVT